MYVQIYVCRSYHSINKVMYNFHKYQERLTRSYNPKFDTGGVPPTEFALRGGTEKLRGGVLSVGGGEGGRVGALHSQEGGVGGKEEGGDGEVLLRYYPYNAQKNSRLKNSFI